MRRSGGLDKRVEELRAALAAEREKVEIYKQAFAWFRRYPEFKPNPELMNEWLPMINAAGTLYEEEARAAHQALEEARDG